MAHVLSYAGTWNNYFTKPFDWKYTSAGLEQPLNREPIKLPVEAAI